MTKNFDALLESMLAEMMPAHMMDDFGPEEMTSAVGKKVEDLPGKSQHWGPLQKLSAGDRLRIIRAIIDNVFTERGNTYTPMADDRNQLKELIKSGIVKATKDHPEFKAGGKWAVQFLADRMANEDLLGKVKYTTEGGDEIKKDVTQKEMKAALNKALGDTKGQSVWKRSQESAKEETPAETAETPVEVPVETSAEEPEKTTETETVYVKAADLSSEDPELKKAFDKLPDSKEMSWQEVIKTIGTSKALALMDAGGLSEETKEKEVGEEDEVQDLDIDDDEDQPEFERHLRDIERGFSGYTRKGFGGDLPEYNF